MKKVLLASCIASISAAVSADVNLPNIGIDGWDSDSQYFRSAAFSQGYLTASGAKNHTVNPAYALDMMNSAEARMDVNGDFSGGVFTTLFGQNLGVYFARPTYDSYLYRVDHDGDGSVYDDDFDTEGNPGSDGIPDSVQDLDNQLGLNGWLPPSNILDTYWASETGLGKVGVRVNYRASTVDMSSDLDDDETDVFTKATFHELHSTVGLVSRSLPLESTVTFGIPFGGYEDINENSNANTRNEIKGEIDKGARWGVTSKYTLTDSREQTTVVSTFIGSAAANYQYTDKETESGTVSTDLTYIQEYFAWGIVGSHEQVINGQTRLLGSVALNRYSGKVGLVNNNAAPSQPFHDEFVTYRVPVAVGVEFRKSEKTTLIGSASADLYNSFSNEDYVNNAGDAEKVSTNGASWYSSNSDVEFGLAYQMTPRLSTNFVVNKSLFSGGLDNGLTTTAQFNYDF